MLFFIFPPDKRQRRQAHACGMEAQRLNTDCTPADKILNTVAALFKRKKTAAGNKKTHGEPWASCPPRWRRAQLTNPLT
jgi:hypothetical protein